MRCGRCHRPLHLAAAVHFSTAYGPKCAAALGLAMPRAPRMHDRLTPLPVDPRQQKLFPEAA